jgi:UbiD family decarboxylase
MKDLRSFLEDAKKADMLHVIDGEVDPLRNVGALCDESEKALMFRNVKGYEGWQVVSNLVDNRDIEQVVFGVKNRSDVVRAMAAAMDAGPSPHEFESNPVCQEVIWEGDDANLLRLPIVQHSELDGGPYIGSAIGIVKDPETGLHNTTWPRVMVGDGKDCPFMIFSPHVSEIAGKYAKLGKPMPMALSIGNHPGVDIAASISVHHPNCGELDFASSILGEKMKFAKCTSIDVDVPSNSEIIVEGETILNHVASEGPFGNYLGTYSTGPMSRDGIQKAPVFRVKRITMRRNPIYRHLQSTVWTEHQRLCMLPMEGVLFNALKEMHIDVHDVYIPSWGGCSATIIQMTPRAAGEAQDALLKASLWENTTISFMSHLCVAVSKDVDIYDARDVLWAMAIRTNWADDSHIIPGTRSSPLMPVAHKVPGVPYRRSSKALIDATVLPPKDDGEWWDQNRAWPMGKGRVSLADFVPSLKGHSNAMQRLVGHAESIARKPGGRVPEIPG